MMQICCCELVYSRNDLPLSPCFLSFDVPLVFLQNIKDNLERLGDQIAGIHERQPDAIQDASPAEVAQIGDALTQLNAEWDRLNRMYSHRKGCVHHFHTQAVQVQLYIR